MYSDLITWNTEYGSVLNSEITTAWENALAAAQKYGSYVAALNAVNASGSTSLGSSYSSSSSSSSTTLTKDTTNSGYSNADMVSAIVSKMKQNAAAWHSASNSERDTLQSQNQTLGAQLAQYGVGAYLDPDTGVWYISSDALNSSNAGKKLFECYHTGGVVGGVGDLDDDEALAKLQNGETVLTKAMWENVTTMLDRMAKMEQAFGNLSALTQGSQLPGSDILDRASTVSNVTNNSQPVNINFGDTIIQGNASSETVAQHTKVTNDMVEQIAKILRIGR